MIKKVGMGILLVGFSGVLIYGAILRTTSRSELTQANSQDRRDHQVSSYDQEKLAEQRGSGAGRQGGGAQGQGNAREDFQTLAEEHPQDWMDQEGSVESLDGDAITIRNTQGDLVLLEGRVLRFIQDAVSYTHLTLPTN